MEVVKQGQDPHIIPTWYIPRYWSGRDGPIFERTWNKSWKLIVRKIRSQSKVTCFTGNRCHARCIAGFSMACNQCNVRSIAFSNSVHLLQLIEDFAAPLTLTLGFAKKLESIHMRPQYLSNFCDCLPRIPSINNQNSCPQEAQRPVHEISKLTKHKQSAHTSVRIISCDQTLRRAATFRRGTDLKIKGRTDTDFPSTSQQRPFQSLRSFRSVTSIGDNYFGKFESSPQTKSLQHNPAQPVIIKLTKKVSHITNFHFRRGM